jgi:hypothetical protein
VIGKKFCVILHKQTSYVNLIHIDVSPTVGGRDAIYFQDLCKLGQNYTDEIAHKLYATSVARLYY